MKKKARGGERERERANESANGRGSESERQFVLVCACVCFFLRETEGGAIDEVGGEEGVGPRVPERVPEYDVRDLPVQGLALGT